MVVPLDVPHGDARDLPAGSLRRVIDALHDARGQLAGDVHAAAWVAAQIEAVEAERQRRRSLTVANDGGRLRVAEAPPAAVWGADRFRSYLFGEGLSKRTVRLYVRQVAKLTAWCSPRGIDPKRIGPLELVAYQRDQVPNSNASRSHVRNALKHFFQMTGRADPPLKAVRVPPTPRRFCRAVSEDDAARLVRTAMGSWPEGGAVMLGLYLGLRASEIATARWDRFSDDRDWYTVTGKFDVTATLPVHPVLRDWTEPRRPTGNDGPLFPGSRSRQYVTPQTIWNWTKRIAGDAGVGELTPHQLRHTALATANDNTGDLRAVMTFARHTKPEVTAGYTRTTRRKLISVVEALDYLNGDGEAAS